jgi:hypothetical protein
MLLRPIDRHLFPVVFRSQARVRGHDDSVVLAEVHKFGLLKVQMMLYLQIVGLDPAVVKYVLYLFDVKVRQADRLYTTTVHLFLQFLETRIVVMKFVGRSRYTIDTDNDKSIMVSHWSVIYFPRSQVVRTGVYFHGAVVRFVFRNHGERSVYQEQVDVVQL